MYKSSWDNPVIPILTIGMLFLGIGVAKYDDRPVKHPAPVEASSTTTTTVGKPKLGILCFGDQGIPFRTDLATAKKDHFFCKEGS